MPKNNATSKSSASTNTHIPSISFYFPEQNDVYQNNIEFKHSNSFGRLSY
jgi:hypothetical protein